MIVNLKTHHSASEYTKAAEVAVSADGTLLFASNRGNQSIAVFDIDSATGLLALRSLALDIAWPRDIAVLGASLLAIERDGGGAGRGAVSVIDILSGAVRCFDLPLRLMRESFSLFDSPPLTSLTCYTGPTGAGRRAYPATARVARRRVAGVVRLPRALNSSAFAMGYELPSILLQPRDRGTRIAQGQMVVVAVEDGQRVNHPPSTLREARTTAAVATSR